MSVKDSNTSQVIVFQSSFTQEVLALTAFNALISLVVGAYGWSMNQTWPTLHRGDPFEYIGVALLTFSVVAPLRRLKQTVRLSENSFSYQHGGTSIRIPWAAMSVFQVSPPNKKWFCRALIGDDNTQVTIDSQSFGDYAKVVKLVGEARKRYRPAD